jgi:hypothetical protein
MARNKGYGVWVGLAKRVCQVHWVDRETGEICRRRCVPNLPNNQTLPVRTIITCLCLTLL